MNQILQAALNLLDIIENNRFDLKAELPESQWQDLLQRVNAAQKSLEEAKDRLEKGMATESDITMVADNLIDELARSEGVRKLLESLQRVVGSKSERSYIIAGLDSGQRDRLKSNSSDLVAFTNRMIKRCEIIRGR